MEHWRDCSSHSAGGRPAPAVTVSVCGGFVPNCDTEIVNVSAGRASNHTAGNGSLVDTEPVMLQPHNIAIVIRSYSSP